MKEKRNTLQKRIVWDIFCSMTNHPSAGMVYDEVCRRYPSISKATVYRLLAEFAEERRLTRIKLSDSTDRFDFNTSRHCHVVCRCCGAVADADIAGSVADIFSGAVGHEGFLLEECQVEFVGLCEKCQKQQSKKINY